jgi:ubiquinone/menaquinone biosynthesis C-methylase UbiE
MLAGKGHKIDAMDISEARLKKFEAQAKELGIRQISGSVYEYSFDKKYDVVIISEVIEHLENYMDILKKACSILKPGGKLIIGVPYKEKIRFCRCPYCLKEFNEYGHINSFDEAVFSSISPELDCNTSSIETFCNKYMDFLFRLSPFKSYKLYICGDRLFSWAAGGKNSQMIVSMIKHV